MMEPTARFGSGRRKKAKNDRMLVTTISEIRMDKQYAIVLMYAENS
jgi:hypothetical protein